MGLINQVGFSGSFEESKSDDSYRNDPTVECVSQKLLQWLNLIFQKTCSEMKTLVPKTFRGYSFQILVFCG